jgi:hypothetical protein
MERKPVVSSNIRSVGFDESTGKMEVEFSNGRIYEYEGDTARSHFAAMTDPNTTSVGSYFAKQVRHDKQLKSLLKDGATPLTNPQPETKQADPLTGSGLQAPEPLKQLF